MDFSSSGVSYHTDDLLTGGSPHDGVADQHHATTLEHGADRVELHLDAEIPNGLMRFDGIDRGFLGQAFSHLDARNVDALAEDNAIRPREVDVLEDALAGLFGGERSSPTALRDMASPLRENSPSTA